MVDYPTYDLLEPFHHPSSYVWPFGSPPSSGILCLSHAENLQSSQLTRCLSNAPDFPIGVFQRASGYLLFCYRVQEWINELSIPLPYAL